MKSLFSLVIGLMLLSFNANAISLTFKLDIFSSGSDIYACNAGLVHPGYTERVCYERDNPSNTCNPGTCTSGEQCNCVCTGDTLNNSGEGEHRLDYFNAKYQRWSDHGERSSISGSVYREAGLRSFNQVTPDRYAYRSELTSLTFNLGSERYGAVYFLDVCYRATQIRYPNYSSINYSHDKQVTITNFSGRYDYERLSGLAVKTVVSCKSKNGNWATREVTDWKRFNGSDVLDYGSKNFREDLEMCKVRYLFKESNTEGVASIRRWNLQRARVCTYTSFNEPVID